MVAKSGDPLLREEAIAALIAELLPLATVLTPNLPEAARILGRPAAADPIAVEEQGRALLALGPAAVLMKGGHADGPVLTDVLVRTGCAPVVLSAERVTTRNTHGTGCTLSSAIAAGLAKGQGLEEAVRSAHAYLQAAVHSADTLAIGSGHGPVHHFHALWDRHG
jgi:hydroxymethylpyrimidine/phosphomethylpyrimidine kinase